MRKILIMLIKRIKISNEKDLKKIISYLKYFKFQDNRKYIHENLILYFYIIARYKLSKLYYPIIIKKNESPDFIYTDNHNDIGLEHTRATIEDFKIAENKLK